MPLISIIITSYNYARFLRDAISSALNQTYRETEVIVVDNGSTDNSRDIIVSCDKRIRPVLKENDGQASAFNTGFAVCNGDIVICLDSTDEITFQKI
jgi:glycosyltransferase involved in cell wall biosynthesis